MIRLLPVATDVVIGVLGSNVVATERTSPRSGERD